MKESTQRLIARRRERGRIIREEKRCPDCDEPIIEKKQNEAGIWVLLPCGHPWIAPSSVCRKER